MFNLLFYPKVINLKQANNVCIDVFLTVIDKSKYLYRYKIHGAKRPRMGYYIYVTYSIWLITHYKIMKLSCMFVESFHQRHTISFRKANLIKNKPLSKLTGHNHITGWRGCPNSLSRDASWINLIITCTGRRAPSDADPIWNVVLYPGIIEKTNLNVF